MEQAKVKATVNYSSLKFLNQYYRLLSEDEYSDCESMRLLLRIVQYMKDEGALLKFEVYREIYPRKFDRCYIVRIRVGYRKMKTRVYRSRNSGDDEDNNTFFENISLNLAKISMNDVWRKHYPSFGGSEMEHKIKKIQTKYSILVQKMYLREAIQEDPIDECKVVRGGKGYLGPGTRVTTLTINFKNAAPTVYKGSYFNVKDLSEASPELVSMEYLLSLSVAMNKAVRYLGKRFQKQQQ